MGSAWSSSATCWPPAHPATGDLLERHHRDLQRRIRDIEGSKAMIEHALSCDEHDFTRCPGFRRLVERLADGGRLDATDRPG